MAAMPTPTAFRLAGTTALVTGGASGIGAATARRLASEGARVVVADRDDVGAQKLAADIDGDALAVDVIDVAAVRGAFAGVLEALGSIDVLINNAGGGDTAALFVHTDEPAWDAALALNLKSVIACTHAVLPMMVDRRRGAIVNVASEAGRVVTMEVYLSRVYAKSGCASRLELIRAVDTGAVRVGET
jgi:2-hydroxycyclohexanecarboxyl-CoA dehydrogenase